MDATECCAAQGFAFKIALSRSCTKSHVYVEFYRGAECTAPSDVRRWSLRYSVCVQVRCIAAVLRMVGKGLEQPEVIKQMLDITETPGRPQYSLASETPLLLHSAGYPEHLAPHYRISRTAAALLRTKVCSLLVACCIMLTTERLNGATAPKRKYARNLKACTITGMVQPHHHDGLSQHC